VPWLPEAFSAPALQHILDERRQERLPAVPYFDGLISGETDALIDSFAGEPELHHPVRGRVKGAPAFKRFVAATNAWIADRNVTIEDVNFVVTPRRGVEEVLLRLDGEHGRVELPLALAADRDEHHRVVELRVYFSSWPLTGRHANRPPVLQPDTDLREPDVVGEYQRALAAGDVDAAVAAFDPDGYVREPAGGEHVHRGTDGLRALYTSFFANGGGIPLEHCAVTDDGRACALEYNVVAWGQTELAPEAGIAVYVRGESGRLAAARIYDDSSPPLR
jgi:SnoaL-like domain